MILALPWIPLLAAFTVLFIPKQNVSFLKHFTRAACWVPFLITLWLLSGFMLHGLESAQFQYVYRFPWLPALGIQYIVGLDGINMTFCLLHALVSLAGAYVATAQKERVKEYLFFYLILTGAVYGTFTVLDIFFMYLFYELTLIPLYPMIGIWGGSARPMVSKAEAKPSAAPNHPEQAKSGERSVSRDILYTKEYGAMKLTIFITAGAVLSLFGVLLLYKELGFQTFDFMEITAHIRRSPLRPEFQKFLAPFFLIGFGVIASLWPLHSWSPIGYAAAPTSVSMLHAGVLKKMGPYLMLRLAVTLLPLGVVAWSSALALLSGIGIVYAGYAAIKQRDLKFMVGFSSVSHMGYVLLGIAALTQTSLSGAVLLVFSHGVMAAATFALIGFIYEQTHMRGIEDYGGLGKILPFWSLCFIMASLASLGLPGFSNFASELLVFIGSWGKFPVIVGFAVFGILITALYLLRAVQKVCYGPLNTRWEKLKDAASFSERFPFLLLLGALLLFGFWPQGLLQIIRPAVGTLVP